MGVSGYRTQSDIVGYPCANINRHYFPSYTSHGGTSIFRNNWAAASDTIMSQISPVNIWSESIIDSTGLLTVNVELYYTKPINHLLYQIN